MLAIALPVPVIVSNFAYYYSRENGRQQSANEDDEEDEHEEGNEEQNGEIKKKKKKGPSKLSCLAMKNKNNIRKVKQRKKKRKTGMVKFPDAVYNAIDANPGTDHPNGLTNSINTKSNPNKDRKHSSSLLETIV